VLPSEGRSRTFESCRARQYFNGLVRLELARFLLALFALTVDVIRA
jgi:hypothetical protein